MRQSEFIQNYFNLFPVNTRWFNSNFEHLSFFKKDICDLYYSIIKKDTINFNKFFYNFFHHNDKSETRTWNNFLSANKNIWLNYYIELLLHGARTENRISIFSHLPEIHTLFNKLTSTLTANINDENNVEPIKITIPFSDSPNLRNLLITDFYYYKSSFVENLKAEDFINQIIIFTIDRYHYLYPKEIEVISELKKNNRLFFLITSQIPFDKFANEPNYKLLSDEIGEKHINTILVRPDGISISNSSNGKIYFMDNLLFFNSINLDKYPIDNILAGCSNCLKEYADILIDNQEYSDESHFFFLESLRFSKKSMEIRMDYSRELEKKAEWEKVIDELAHSLNTNIGAARDSIHSIVLFSDNNNLIEYSNEAECFMREAAELVDLTLDSLKLELNQSNLKMISLSEIITGQINTIMKGITTLRFSNNKHLQNVKKMNIRLSLDDSIYIQTYPVAANLIIKDLLKNAILNTDQDTPDVMVSTYMINQNTALLSITNNKIISKEWADWINFDTEVEEIRMSKSRRVGMRVVKRWKPKLKWLIYVSSDEINSATTTSVTIPLYVLKKY